MQLTRHGTQAPHRAQLPHGAQAPHGTGAPRGARRSLAALAACATLAAHPAASQPSREVLDGAAPAIVRVIASGCGGTARGGTGFAWESAGQIVTALHVVAGCDTLRVNFQGIGERPARVARLFRPADLALLAVDQPPTLTPLLASTRIPVGETVMVFGYGLDTSTREERPLYVTTASTSTPLLSDAVNAEARTQLLSLGAPALETEILRVDGNLLPGHSGAPVLDAAGRVVGIGSGGLQRGTVGVGWAIRARYLAELARAPALADGRAPGLGTAPNSPGYATLALGAGALRARCGQLDFIRSRTGLSLATLVASSDDQRGFQSIAMTAGRPWDVLAAMQFDIWTEQRSGAGVAVPAGGTLTPQAHGCTARWANGLVDLFVSGADVPAANDPTWPMAVELTTSAFGNAWAQEFLPFLQIDPGFSYGPPRSGPGGLLINRMTFIGQRPGQVPHAAFQTLLAKGNATIGVAAITRHYPYPMTPPPDEATYRAWVAAALAAYLSTVPP